MRKKNAIINTLAGGLGTLFVGVLQFVSRFIFIKFLSDEYLGISSLFTNILSILSLAELGIGTAIAYSLYKPLRTGDEDTIRSIMAFFKKAYMIIGLAVLLLGMLMYPFMPFLIKGETDLVDIRIIYALYVLQSAVTYFFWGYKTILLQADQKLYICKGVNVIVTAFITAASLITLAVFKDFILYSVIGLLVGVVTNIICGVIVDRSYPYLKKKDKPLKLSEKERKKIFRDVAGMSLFKFNTTVVNSTDNILISAFINVKTVALYGNYQIIISGISQVIMQFFAGVTAPVGNLEAGENEKGNEFVFRCIQLLCFWVYSFVGTALFFAIDPVIMLFFGKERMLSAWIVFLQILYFVINGFQRTSFIYRDACGLFWKGKLRPVVTALLNLGISILLGYYTGLSGIILGTIISWMLTTFWYDPVMIYRNVFKKSPVSYFLGYLKAAVIFATGFASCFAARIYIPHEGVSRLASILLSVIIPNVLFFVFYRKSEEFKYLKSVFNKGRKNAKI